MAEYGLKISPKLKGEDGYKTFSIRIKDEIVGEIDVISERTGRSRNELIGIMLKYALSMYEADEDDEKDNDN